MLLLFFLPFTNSQATLASPMLTTASDLPAETTQNPLADIKNISTIILSPTLPRYLTILSDIEVDTALVVCVPPPRTGKMKNILQVYIPKTKNLENYILFDSSDGTRKKGPYVFANESASPYPESDIGGTLSPLPLS